MTITNWECQEHCNKSQSDRPSDLAKVSADQDGGWRFLTAPCRPCALTAWSLNVSPLFTLMNKTELTDSMLEIGARLFPRRYHRFRDLRPCQEAGEWARTLDWRQNPYDRFLLRRELLRHLESTEYSEGRLKVFSFASREEIAAEVDRLLGEFPDKFESVGVFDYVLVLLPWNLGFKHGRISYSRLTEALARRPAKDRQ